MKTNTEYDFLVLGDGADGFFDMNPENASINHNVLVIAGTGGGKTKSVVETNLLHSWHKSMVVLLTKRRLINIYSPLLKKRGYDVKVLNLVHPEKSEYGYDPILHIKDDSDLMALGRSIMSCTKTVSAKEPYWENSACSLFCAIADLARKKFERKPRMREVLHLLYHMDEKEVTWTCSSEYSEEDEEWDRGVEGSYSLADEFELLKHDEPRMFSDWLQYNNNADVTKACIRSVLLTAVNTLMTKGICLLMDKDRQIDFPSLVKRKTVLFVLTSPVNPALHPFANLIFGSLFKELFEYAESLPDGRLPIPLMAICDDFATGGTIPDFQHHISIFREKGISVMMLIQSLSQLVSMYGENGAQTICDNTDCMVYLGGNDLFTAEQIARRINKPVYDVLCLPVGSEYLFVRGQKPLELQRYQIYDDPVYVREVEQMNTGLGF
ncbi:MAG: type IV secretory system conjugative DNA transfer family protein [Acidaminococcaceae bacterium]|nr:type IV secretory system conjugative DNA transfer family protein [Acidaminococcaceae bacterium]